MTPIMMPPNAPEITVSPPSQAAKIDHHSPLATLSANPPCSHSPITYPSRAKTIPAGKATNKVDSKMPCFPYST